MLATALAFTLTVLFRLALVLVVTALLEMARVVKKQRPDGEAQCQEG